MNVLGFAAHVRPPTPRIGDSVEIDWPSSCVFNLMMEPSGVQPN